MQIAVNWCNIFIVGHCRCGRCWFSIYSCEPHNNSKYKTHGLLPSDGWLRERKMNIRSDSSTRIMNASRTNYDYIVWVRVTHIFCERINVPLSHDTDRGTHEIKGSRSKIHRFRFSARICVRHGRSSLTQYCLFKVSTTFFSPNSVDSRHAMPRFGRICTLFHLTDCIESVKVSLFWLIRNESWYGAFTGIILAFQRKSFIARPVSAQNVQIPVVLCDVDDERCRLVLYIWIKTIKLLHKKHWTFTRT